MIFHELPMRNDAGEKFFLENSVLCVEKDNDRLLEASPDDVVDFVKSLYDIKSNATQLLTNFSLKERR